MQRPSYTLGIVALGVATLVAVPARASDTKLTEAVELRAGPSMGYPAVKRLARGLKIQVHGCLSSWDWCDVAWRGTRGWVPSSIVEFQREDMRLLVDKYGPSLGVPEVNFVLTSYWGANYSTSVWYADRDMWRRRSARDGF